MPPCGTYVVPPTGKARSQGGPLGSRITLRPEERTRRFGLERDQRGALRCSAAVSIIPEPEKSGSGRSEWSRIREHAFKNRPGDPNRAPQDDDRKPDPPTAHPPLLGKFIGAALGDSQHARGLCHCEHFRETRQIHHAPRLEINRSLRRGWRGYDGRIRSAMGQYPVSRINKYAVVLDGTPRYSVVLHGQDNFLREARSLAAVRGIPHTGRSSTDASSGGRAPSIVHHTAPPDRQHGQQG